jgi:ribosomal protein S27AE
MNKQPKNQKAYCPVCGIGVTLADDSEETECPNCSYQFQTNWGRTVQALRYNKLKASNEKLVKYTRHHDECKKWARFPECRIFDPDKPCTCGLEQALAEAGKI